MTGASAVVAREIQEWKRVFVAAFAAGLLVYLAPILPVPAGTGGMETMNALSAFMATAFGLGVALLAGAGLIGRDLTERRMTFYFYKPLAEASIWGGKMLAALILAFVSAILTLVPATLVGQGLFSLREQQPLRGFTLLVMGMVALVILGNSLNLTFRARSKWVLLDLLCLGIVSGLLAIATLPLAEAHALGLVLTLAIAILVLLLLSLLIAGLVGMVSGRIDLREVHRYHSFTLWPIMGAAALATIAFSMWVRSAGPEDLGSVHVAEASAQGPWIAVYGGSDGRGDYLTTLLINVETGQAFPVRGGPIPAEKLQISRDGRRAVWLEPIGLEPSRGRVMVASLGRKPTIRSTNILAVPHLTDGVLSPDGGRLALLSAGLLTVIDLDSETALGSVRIPPSEQVSYNWTRRMMFIEPDVIRVFARWSDTILKIYEFDVARKKFEQTGTLVAEGDFFYNISSHDRILVKPFRKNVVSLHDARSGQRIAVLAEGMSTHAMRGFLADGRLVVAKIEDRRGKVYLFSADGTLEKTIDLGPAGVVRLGGEPEQGKLVVATAPTDGHIREFQASLITSLIDLRSGEIKSMGPQLMPLTYMWWHIGGPPAQGSVATKIFRSPDDRALIYLDPMTGERRVIAGRG